MAVEESGNDVRGFLAVFAALLLDNVLRLDESVGQVTDLVMARGKPDRELVVALQGFDRLKQEFEALGDALTRYADASNGTALGEHERAQLEQSVIAAISLHDLKDRLVRGMQDDLPVIPAPPLSDAVVAQIDVDVEF